MTIQINGTDWYMPDSYGRIDMAAATTKANGYICIDNHDKQMDVQLLACIQESIDSEMKKEMSNKSDEYMIQGDGAAANAPNQSSSLLYLMAMVKQAEAQSRAIGSNIHKKITQLPEYMVEEAVFDIKMFCTYVHDNIHELTNRNMQAMDVVVYILEAFDEVQDEDFRHWAGTQSACSLKVIRQGWSNSGSGPACSSSSSSQTNERVLLSVRSWSL